MTEKTTDETPETETAAKVDDTKVDDAKADDVNADDVKADDVKADDDQAGPAETKSVLDTLELARGEVNDDDVGALQEAIDNLDFATRKASPERLDTLRGLAARLTSLVDQIDRGVRPEADQEERQLTSEQEDRYQKLFDQGIAAAEQGNLREAADHLEEVVRIDPVGISGLFNLGVVYGLLAHKNITTMEFYDDYVRDEVYIERAQICYDAVLTQEPTHLRSLINLATLASMRDDRQTAVEYLRRIAEINPSDDSDRNIVERAKTQLNELESI